MTAPLRAVKSIEELGQVEREAAAWNNYIAAIARQDKDEAVRLWRVYAAIHAQRPAAMVEALERAKGLR